MYLGVIRSRPTAYSIVTIKKYKCKNNIKLIYLTFMLCTCKFKKLNQFSLLKTMNKLFLTKGIKNLSLPKNIFEHVMRKRVLRRQIVFLRVRCSILSLLIKSFRCNIPHCKFPAFTQVYSIKCKPGSLVGIVTGYRLDGPGIESRWERDFPRLSTPALGPTQSPVQWVPGLSRGYKAAGA
jgi:hypothetical protein